MSVSDDDAAVDKSVPHHTAPMRTRTLDDVIDAVTGATWQTRNRIMEDMFHEDLKAGVAGMPEYCPPGTSLEHTEKRTHKD